MNFRILLARHLFAPLLWLGLATIAFAETPAKAWPQAKSDLSPDPRLHFGRLENGLRYVIMPHAEPPGRVSIRLHVHAGSFMEEENQRGLAHFLEHMAFNGTRHYRGTEIVEFLQRLGMAFGPDINAHTSFDETVYKLDLPDVQEATLDKGLTIMRDWADGMLLDAEEIDRERGVILKEKLGRDTIRFRLMEAALGFLFPDSLIPARMPIGLEEVIEKAQRERFLEFYQTYYRPDRMVLVVVGDIDREDMEGKIKAVFEDMRPMRPETVVEEPVLGRLTNDGVRTHVEVEPEASGVSVSLSKLSAYEDVPDNAARRAERLLVSVVHAMVNRRLSILAKEAEAPFISGGAYASDFFKFADMANLELQCQPEQWRAALSLAEQELRRAVLHGFTEAELKEAKAELLNRYERAVETAATEKSPEIANAIVSSIGDGQVYSSPEEDLRLARQTLSSVTLSDCQETMKEHWGPGPVHVMVSGNLGDAPTAETVAEVYLQSRAEAVEPPEQVEEQPFAYREVGAPGEVTSRQNVGDLGVTQLVLSNGVRVNLKPTDFEQNTIRIAAVFGRGTLSQPVDKPGIDLFTRAVFEAAGLEAHSADDLQRLFAGKNVGISFSIDDDHFEIAGRTTPDDLRDQLQLMCAYLMAAGYREEAESRIRRMYPMLMKQMASTPEGVMQAKVDRYLHGGDPRFGVPDLAALEALSLEDVKAWIDGALKRAPLEVSLVGEFEIAETIDLVRETFGALPERDGEREMTIGDEERTVKFPRGDSEKRYLYESKLGKALTLVYWPAPDRFSDIRRARRLSVLSNLLADRLRSKIREELGEAYSPMAHYVGSEAFPGYGMLFAMSPGSSDKAELVAEWIVELGADLAEKGVAQDEFERAINPILTSLKEQTRNNGYWLSSVLSQCQSRPEGLEWARTMTDDFEAITRDEIQALAEDYLAKERSLKVLIVTDSSAEPDDAGANGSSDEAS